MTEDQTLAPDSEASNDAIDQSQLDTPDFQGKVDTTASEGVAQDSQLEPDTTTGEDDVAPEKAQSDTDELTPSHLEEIQRLREEAETARSEKAALEAKLAAQNAKALESTPPQEGDFEDYAEYQAALAVYKSLEALDERERKAAEAAAAEHQKHLDTLAEQEAEIHQAQWCAQVSSGTKQYADFNEVALNPNLQITASMARVLASSEAGADLAYHLGKEPSEAARFGNGAGSGTDGSQFAPLKTRKHHQSPHADQPGKALRGPRS